MLIHFPHESRLTTLFTGLVKNPNEDVLRGIEVIVVQSRALLPENSFPSPSARATFFTKPRFYQPPRKNRSNESDDIYLVVKGWRPKDNSVPLLWVGYSHFSLSSLS